MSEQKTDKVRKFLLQKFPTSEYMDCPIPRHHWDAMQEYADQQTAALRQEISLARLEIKAKARLLEQCESALRDREARVITMKEGLSIEAIQFAEWIRTKAYTGDDDLWYVHKYMSGESYTTSDLYSLYNKSKEINNG